MVQHSFVVGGGNSGDHRCPPTPAPGKQRACRGRARAATADAQSSPPAVPPPAGLRVDLKPSAEYVSPPPSASGVMVMMLV